MNKGLVLLLRAIGVNITDDDAKMIEGMIPKIPGMVQNIYTVIQQNMANIDTRMKALESVVQSLKEEIERNGIATKP